MEQCAATLRCVPAQSHSSGLFRLTCALQTVPPDRDDVIAHARVKPVAMRANAGRPAECRQGRCRKRRQLQTLFDSVRYAVIVEGPCGSLDITAGRHWHSHIRREVRATVDLPCARQNHLDTICRRAEPSWIPFHQDKVGASAVDIPVELCYFAATGRQPRPRRELRQRGGFPPYRC
jgi:hypothetical protein